MTTTPLDEVYVEEAAFHDAALENPLMRQILFEQMANPGILWLPPRNQPPEVKEPVEEQCPVGYRRAA
ncbi:MAG: hypothetical protein HYZ50_05770 [Deltaproteobacteria bacterium]|nr:hypothetical protein [Deltaproteobacteria bacterium]